MDPPKHHPPDTSVQGGSLSHEDSFLEDALFGARTVDQETLEHQVAIKAEKEIITQANEDDCRRLQKAQNAKEKFEYQLRRAHDQLKTAMTSRSEIYQRIKELQENIFQLSEDILDISERISQRTQQVEALSGPQVDTIEHRLPNESNREYLIRTGKITPFDKLPGIERISSTVEPEIITAPSFPNSQIVTAQNLRKPGFGDEDQAEASALPEKGSVEEKTDDESIFPSEQRKRRSKRESDDEYAPQTPKVKNKRRRLIRQTKRSTLSSETSGDGDEDGSENILLIRKSRSSKNYPSTQQVRLDDGDEKMYQKRILEWSSERNKAREKHGMYSDDEQLEEWHMPHPTHLDQIFSDEFKLPGDIHPSLFDYQKISVRWLWELHCQEVGGILGDEMGLGKTIQVIAFIAGLHYSGMLDKPCIIVAPGAVLKQWASEFHTWWPALRVAILHSSGSGMLVARTDDIDSDEDQYNHSKASKNSQATAKKIVQRVFRDGHVLVTTYEGLTTYGNILLDQVWAYAVLDEGHRIRNPDAKVSLTCKQLKTAHRLILSGTPVQNNLVELWSLFDFVYPGRLGTLPVFREQFEVPIRIGGYKSATNIQVQTATKCAFVLRDMIGPYLLRRLKIDVMRDLPSKHEKVVFCRLTKAQHAKYLEYLKSPEVQRILDGELKSLAGISVLRKLCSHPDLVDREYLEKKHGYGYGHSSQSGKMQITKKMLLLWKEQGHRSLLFSQSVQILDILEKDIKKYEGFQYRRMDGSTPIPLRQELVDEFNKDESIDVFLMTTRVGGLGLNLTGADRVIIFDPDWNPSTDLQESSIARERAWRIGQRKSVSIFRLVAAGTIEEKMYNRQLFKQHLSQKVLSDATQRRVFESDTLKDLFTLSSGGGGTSTGAMFRGAETIYNNGLTKFPDGQAAPMNVSELSGITGVTGLHDYKIQATGEAETGNESGEKQFIDQIFAHTGVISTLEHDQAVGVSKPHSSTAEKYAADVARAAAERLEESIKAAQSAVVGTLTWTGRNGLAGREEMPPKRASASSLLKRLKFQETNSSAIIDKRPMLYQMLDLFKQACGKISTPDIKVWCADREIDKCHPERAEEMRLVLRELAVLNKVNHQWELKPQFTES